MKDYITTDPWKIVENGFHPEHNMITESLCSLGNGKMGLRGNLAENYSGLTLQGSYYAGIYYPDKTKVGWWKNGYPEYFAKVLNGCNWIGLKIEVEGESIDLNECEIHTFQRVLDMQHGILFRESEISLKNGARLLIKSQRFCSMDNDELACLNFTIKSINFTGKIEIESFLDFDIANADSNYDEKFWHKSIVDSNDQNIYNQAETKKTAFELGLSAVNKVNLNSNPLVRSAWNKRDKYIGEVFVGNIALGESLELTKYVGVSSSLYHNSDQLKDNAVDISIQASKVGFNKLKEKHNLSWIAKWNESDITISNDDSAQQGIRFNIFHLHQTYTGQDDRLNIGPKGFTGEKYGGSTYWDTEAYCLPFYLSTAKQSVSRNLLVYRYKHLQKAIENAEKLGFEKGAALYPMVTINGEECHNEWEITFEEIHRNGAIAYAIYDYINYTGDSEYLYEYGLEVLIAICRFWAQRVNYSEVKQKYVMLGVTGPNEYENNVNNNWYTNYIAKWCLDYTLSCLKEGQIHNDVVTNAIYKKVNLSNEELSKWQEVSSGMYFPESKNLGIFLQQDNFLDKDQTPVSELDPKHLPLNQKWSWDRILRSVFIKQADVLQGIYLFEDHFHFETIERNFNYYEPRTVHESSLSPCVHAILASKLGQKEKAYEMYLRTSRLDIDDYNNDTEDGLHITSMAGTWMSVIKGFAGMRVREGQLFFDPSLPINWDSIGFKIRFRATLLSIEINQDKFSIENKSNQYIEIRLRNQTINIPSNEKIATII